VQQSLLRLIGECLCHLVGAAVRSVDRVEAEERAGFAFEISRDACRLRRVAGDVKVGASSLCTVKGVVSPDSVKITLPKSALISPFFA
jgi:hypothetical protein